MTVELFLNFGRDWFGLGLCGLFFFEMGDAAVMDARVVDISEYWSGAVLHVPEEIAMPPARSNARFREMSAEEDKENVHPDTNSEKKFCFAGKS